MGKSSLKKDKSDRIKELRKKYDDFLEEDKKRKKRNDYILGRLDKMRAASMALRVPYGVPRTCIAMAPQILPYYNQHQVRDEPITQTVVANPYPILRDIPTKLNENADESKIIKEISKRFILIPKLTTIERPNIEPSQKYDDPDWTSKYEILDKLKKCEKENIELVTNIISKNKSKKISFQDDTDDDTISTPVKDINYNKETVATKENNYENPYKKLTGSEEYDIETFQCDLDDKNNARYKHTSNLLDDKKHSDVVASKPETYKNINNEQTPVQTKEQVNYDNYTDLGDTINNTGFSKPEAVQLNVETHLKETIPKEDTINQGNDEKDYDSTQEYPNNIINNAKIVPNIEEEKYITKEEITDKSAKTPVQQEGKKQEPQMSIETSHENDQYQNTDNFNDNNVDTRQANLPTYEENNVIGATIANNYYDETNLNVVNTEYPKQSEENYEGYNQNATDYYNPQEQYSQGQQDPQYDKQNEQYQDQLDQPYSQEPVPPQHERVYDDPSTEPQLQYDPNQIKEGQYDKVQQNHSEHGAQDHALQYDPTQTLVEQYDLNQTEEQQYDQNQVQEYEQEQQQYEGMYNEVQGYQPEYNADQVNNVQYDQGLQEQQYSQEVRDQQYGQEVHDQQYGQGVHDQQYSQEVHDQQYGQEVLDQQYGQEVHDQQYGQEVHDQQYRQEVHDQQYDQEVRDQQYSQEGQLTYDADHYVEQSEQNIVQEGNDTNYTQVVDQNIVNENVSQIELEK